ITEEKLACTRSPIAIVSAGSVCQPKRRSMRRTKAAASTPSRAAQPYSWSRVRRASAAVTEGATPKSMSATHAGSTSGGNLCHLLVRRARNVAMSKSVASVVVMRLLSIVAHGATGGEDQRSYHPVTPLPPDHEFESQYAAPRRRTPLFGGRQRH